jgi:hydrogenase-4 component F
MKISFDAAQTPVRIKESASLVWPQYALLLTSLVLCCWMPDTLYQTIRQAVSAVGGGF